MNFSALRVFLLVLVAGVFLSFNSGSSTSSQYKLLFFEGSDWCINCIRFEKKILSENAFEDFAQSNQIVLERIDFPQRKQLDESTKRYNESMAEKYDFQGVFPTLVLVNVETDAYRTIRYQNQDLNEFVTVVLSKLKEIP